MYYIAYLTDFKENIIVPQNWILNISDHLEKFINNSINSNQTFVCFYTNNNSAFDENRELKTNYPPKFNIPFGRKFSKEPKEGLYNVQLKAFRSKLILKRHFF